MLVRALAWNLYHGRDRPPGPELLTWRSRLLRTSERNRIHVQLNRELAAEFEGLLAASPWQVALLQECPPRWAEGLGRRCEAEHHMVLTSRNSLAPLRTLAARLNPDLIASNEGGSNVTLVRGRIVARRELELRPGPRPERRMMAFTRAHLGPDGPELCLANLHLSSSRANRPLAEQEARLAADRARAWAGGAPLLLGGDFNLRPSETAVFDELAERHGLRGPTANDAIDHILHRGLDPVEPAHRWPPQRRELAHGGLALRLSDHAPVEAAYSITGRGCASRGPG
jgi:endonuclease/exonuclease/phosphatase family metal-dependent hydrolase